MYRIYSYIKYIHTVIYIVIMYVYIYAEYVVSGRLTRLWWVALNP